VESDPLGMRAGINTYAYVRGNPLDRRDILGLVPGWDDRSGPPNFAYDEPLPLLFHQT